MNSTPPLSSLSLTLFTYPVNMLRTRAAKHAGAKETNNPPTVSTPTITWKDTFQCSPHVVQQDVPKWRKRGTTAPAKKSVVEEEVNSDVSIPSVSITLPHTPARVFKSHTPQQVFKFHPLQVFKLLLQGTSTHLSPFRIPLLPNIPCQLKRWACIITVTISNGAFLDSYPQGLH